MDTRTEDPHWHDPKLQLVVFRNFWALQFVRLKIHREANIHKEYLLFILPFHTFSKEFEFIYIFYFNSQYKHHKCVYKCLTALDKIRRKRPRWFVIYVFHVNTFVPAECVRCPWAAGIHVVATLNGTISLSPFLFLELLTFLPERGQAGSGDFAWVPKKPNNRIPIKKNGYPPYHPQSALCLFWRKRKRKGEREREG